MKLKNTVGFENRTNNQQGYPCTIKILLTFMYLYFVHRNYIASIFYNHDTKCLVMVERLFLAVPRGCLQFVIVVFPDHTNLLFLTADSILFREIV